MTIDFFSAFWKVNITLITQPLLPIIAQYLAQRLKSVSQNQKYFEILLLIKSKMAAGRRLENTLIAIIRPKFEISSRNLLRRYILAVHYLRRRHIPVMTISKMAAAAILKNHSNGRTSVAISHTDTISCSETKIGVPEPEISWNFASDKIQDGGR